MFYRRLNMLHGRLNMLHKRLQHFSTQAISHISNKCEKCRSDEFILSTYASIFAIGWCVELYTYCHTKDVTKSTGLGWATLVILLI